MILNERYNVGNGFLSEDVYDRLYPIKTDSYYRGLNMILMKSYNIHYRMCEDVIERVNVPVFYQLYPLSKRYITYMQSNDYVMFLIYNLYYFSSVNYNPSIVENLRHTMDNLFNSVDMKWRREFSFRGMLEQNTISEFSKKRKERIGLRTELPNLKYIYNEMGFGYLLQSGLYDGNELSLKRLFKRYGL